MHPNQRRDLPRSELAEFRQVRKQCVDCGWPQAGHSDKALKLLLPFGLHLHSLIEVMIELRGREKVDGQWRLFALVHNIEKLAHCGMA